MPGLLFLITLVNLRGVRETAVAFMVPTYLFVGCLFALLAFGVAKAIASGGQPAAVAPPPKLASPPGAANAWLLLRAFASGCTAMTGVEAVSNGVVAFRDPPVKFARRTLTTTVAILALLLAGIAYLCQAYRIGATAPGQAGYQSVLSQLTAAVAGRGWFYYAIMLSLLMVLALQANTAFAGFPQLCRSVAQNGFLPRSFIARGRRLVYSACWESSSCCCCP